MNIPAILKNKSIFNICMIFGAATMAPTAVFAPLGTWIPLTICALGAIASNLPKSGNQASNSAAKKLFLLVSSSSPKLKSPSHNPFI